MEEYLYSPSFWLLLGNALAIVLLVRIANKDSLRRGRRYKYLIEKLDESYGYYREAALLRESRKEPSKRKTDAEIQEELIEAVRPHVDALVYFVKLSRLFSPRQDSKYFPSLTSSLLQIEKENNERLDEWQKRENERLSGNTEGQDPASQSLAPTIRLQNTNTLIELLSEGIVADIEREKLQQKYRDTL